MTTTELVFVGEVWADSIALPYAVSSHARFETLYTHDGEQEPEEPNQEGNIDQQRCRFFQTAENYLQDVSDEPFSSLCTTCRGSTGQIQEANDSQAAKHVENKNDASILDAYKTQKERYPKRDDG